MTQIFLMASSAAGLRVLNISRISCEIFFVSVNVCIKIFIMEYNYYIEAINETTRFLSQPKTKAAALREIRKFEKLGYSGIKLVLIGKIADNEK